MSVYLYIHKPTIIWKARVSSAEDLIYPKLNINWDRETFGSYTSVRVGQTVLLGSSEGWDDLGRQRVISGASSLILPVALSSYGNRDGEIMAEVDAYITVLDEYRIWAKIPRANEKNEVLPDGGIPHTDYNQEPFPCSNPGPAIAGTASVATGKFRVTLGSNWSFQFDPTVSLNVSPVSNFSWSVPGGTYVTGSSSSQFPVVDLPPGFRYVRLTVTGDNGKAHTAYQPVFVRDPSDDANVIRHQVVSHQITPKGQELQIKLFSPLDPITYPSGMMCILWEEHPTYGRKTLFHGWHVAESTSTQSTKTARLNDITMRFVDVNGRLTLLPGFTQIMRSLQAAGAATAYQWDLARYNNILFYTWHILYWFTTALNVVDFRIDNYVLSMYEFAELGSDDQNVYDQINTLMNRVTPDHYVTCTQGGQIFLTIDPLILQSGSRAEFIPVYGTIFAKDMIDISWELNRPPKIAELISGAIKSQSDYDIVDGHEVIPTIFCLAPGEMRGQGASKTTLGSRIASDEYTLYTSEGNRYARLNSPYGPITATMTWDYWLALGANLDIAHMSFVEVLMDVYPLRPYPVSLIRCVVQQANVNYSYSETAFLRTITLTLEVETEGPPAEEFTPLDED